MNRIAHALALVFTFVFAPYPTAAFQASPMPAVVPEAESAPATAPPSPAAVAFPAAVAPVIDGRDDDFVWESAVRVQGFLQVDPDEGADPAHPTEFQVAFDADQLYVLVRAFDSHPDSILHALTRRDVRGPSDQIQVVVDSYHDRRTGYTFAVNPDGVKRDEAIFNDGNRDGSWDGVWDVATTVDELGWIAEFRIPLSQLRYPDADRHAFGLAIYRTIERYPQITSWPLIRRSRPGIASQLATLEGLTGLSSSRSIEVTPYAVARSETAPRPAGTFGRAQDMDVGADAKLRLTPNLTVDATINPDFGQVEADPAVLSLDAFEVFVSEKRPFFVEGTGLYRLPLNCYTVVDCNTNEGLFYPRRVGRAPALADVYGDASTPTATPIAGAAKVTGQSGRGLSFGLLSAVTQEVEGPDDSTVEPLTNHAVLSLDQNLRGGEAGVRVLVTAVNRRGDEWAAPYLHSGAYSTALSVRNRFREGNFEASGLFAGSRVAGSREAIARTQRGAVHYYQQPDDRPAFDPDRTSLSGYSTQLKVGKYGGGITRFETSLVRHSAGFDVNDLGYLRRADVQDWSTWAALRWIEPTSAYRWLQVNGNFWRTWNTSGSLLETALNFNAHMGLHNNWDAHAGFTVDHLGETRCDRCTRGGPLLRESRGFRPWFGVNTDPRRMFAPGIWVNLGYDDEGRSRSVSIDPSVGVRVSTQLDGRLGIRYRRNEDASQWLGNFTTEGATHYAFARLDQETVSAEIRLNYTARPNLTVQLYAEPFISSGTYSDVRELSETPGAGEFEDRFIPYTPPASAPDGFRFQQLRTNLVFRWEYLPGSTLFLVWAHGRQASEGPSDLDLSDELDELFDLHPDNTFLIKVAHWLSW